MTGQSHVTVIVSTPADLLRAECVDCDWRGTEYKAPAPAEREAAEHRRESIARE